MSYLAESGSEGTSRIINWKVWPDTNVTRVRKGGKKRKFSEKQMTPEEVIKTNRETSAHAGDIRSENDLNRTIIILF